MIAQLGILRITVVCFLNVIYIWINIRVTSTDARFVSILSQIFLCFTINLTLILVSSLARKSTFVYAYTKVIMLVVQTGGCEPREMMMKKRMKELVIIKAALF